MRNYFCFLWIGALGLLSGSARAQSKPAADTARRYVEVMPVFPGGPPDETVQANSQRAMKFLNQDVKYPPKALRDGVQGRVFFSFAVDAAGHTTDIKLVKGIRADMDAEVLRNAHRMDSLQWRPGTQNGKPVRVQYTVPITFSLSGNPTGRTTASGDSLDTGPYNKIVLPMPSWGPDRVISHPDKALVYGSCIQRLGFSSGGFGQYIRLVNLSTGKAIRIEVKPPMRSRKESAFCYALPPGRYAIYKYEFTHSKWYGGEMHEENIRKSTFEPETKGQLKATRFLFTVEAGKLYYLGTWNLEQENQPQFSNQKAELDAQLTPIFKHLNFEAAVLTIPD